jgi:hypothetical protein
MSRFVSTVILWIVSCSWLACPTVHAFTPPASPLLKPPPSLSSSSSSCNRCRVRVVSSFLAAASESKVDTAGTDLQNKQQQKTPTTFRSPNQQALFHAKPFPRTWVPLGSVLELNPDRPTELHFLGQSYVAFRVSSSSSNNNNKNDSNEEEEWMVTDNACPHRLAPLSEGRIVETTTNDSNNYTNRNLQCAYHGWTFRGSDGTCLEIL